MSAAEDDTELRDLLIQNLENSGVLNKLKAEMRAAVFLAMEDQDRLENKTPLINENLKKCLNTKDGHLVASLIMDFLQVFNLDFSLAVFQPEINSLNGLDSRDLVCRELGVSDSELNQNAPVLLELVRRARRSSDLPVRSEVRSGSNPVRVLTRPDAAKTHLTHVSVCVVRETGLSSVVLQPENTQDCSRFYYCYKVTYYCVVLFPAEVDFQAFLSTYKRLFDQCRSVVRDSRIWRIFLSSFTLEPRLDQIQTISVVSLPKRYLQQQEQPTEAGSAEHLDLELDGDVDHDEGDSFFDDPLPKPLKTYGCSMNETGPNDPIDGFFFFISTDEDVEYDDDFNSHRSDLSNGELSIGEEMEEVSIEGPETSDKLDETTQDLSVSQISQSHGADYMEDVS
uniref:Centrosomal protein 43 n=1 Tax=Poecilia reticulata TaxID=8081 RepID=A0A3P9PKZ4_POERE